MTDIEEDPFLIESWIDYCKLCISSGQLWRFRKALSEYISITNSPAKAEIKAYAVGRMGEMAKEKLLKDKHEKRIA